MTMADIAEHVRWEGQYAGAKAAKNLFFYDKKKKERMWVICAADDTEIDVKALCKLWGVGSGNLRGGSEEAMYEFLGARKGGLNLFAMVNDTENKVKLIIDKRLTEEFEYITYHPMVNTATCAITKEDMMKVIQLS